MQPSWSQHCSLTEMQMQHAPMAATSVLNCGFKVIDTKMEVRALPDLPFLQDLAVTQNFSFFVAGRVNHFGQQQVSLTGQFQCMRTRIKHEQAVASHWCGAVCINSALCRGSQNGGATHQLQSAHRCCRQLELTKLHPFIAFSLQKEHLMISSHCARQSMLL